MNIQPANRIESVTEYYFSKKLKEVKELNRNGNAIINLGVGSPDLAPPQSVLDKMSAVSQNNGIHGYQPYIGREELRNSIAQFYKNHYQVAVNPKNEILPLMGSKEGIFHISMAFLNPGDYALVPNPGYPAYSATTKLTQATPIEYKLNPNNNWLPDLDTIESPNWEKTKIMWLNYPHMPTGASLAESDFLKIIEFANQKNILLVNDNPYSFILNEKPTSLLNYSGITENCLELNSLSKTFNIAGWRLGMLLGHSHLIEQVLKVKSNMDSGMYFGLQEGAIEALKMPASWYTKINQTYLKRRKVAWQILEKLECTYSKETAGMFVWGKTPWGVKGKELADRLLYDHQIFVAPGFIFGSVGESYIRISLCASLYKMNQALSEITYSKQTKEK